MSDTTTLDLDAIKARLTAARAVCESPNVSIAEWSHFTGGVVADVEPLIAEVETLRALRPETTQAVLAHMDRADRAEAAIARVRAWHSPVPSVSQDNISTDRCDGCGEWYPCATVSALDGEGGQQR